MEQKIRPVDFGQRFGAWIIDFIIVVVLGIVLVPVFTVLGTMLGGAAGAATSQVPSINSENSDVMGIFNMLMNTTTGARVGFIIGVNLLTILYCLMEGLAGYTFGKLMVGIQIGLKGGKKAPKGVLLKRFLVKYLANVFAISIALIGLPILSSLSNLIALVLTIGCLFALGESRQALHDMMVGTSVFRRSDLKVLETQRI